MNLLRPVPTIVFVHTLCVSQDTLGFLSVLLNNTGPDVFARFKTMQRSFYLSKYSLYPKWKLGLTMHSLEIIKLQFEKERHALLCILEHFANIVHE